MHARNPVQGNLNNGAQVRGPTELVFYLVEFAARHQRSHYSIKMHRTPLFYKGVIIARQLGFLQQPTQLPHCTSASATSWSEGSSTAATVPCR